MDQYHYKRPLQGIKNQWHKLTLPDDIFGRLSPDLSDIRIFGITPAKDTLEAPYILKVASDERVETEVPFNLINQTSNDKGFYYTFEVPADSIINTIEFDFDQENFDWRITLEGSQDQKEWFAIVKDYRILGIENDITDYRFTRVKFKDAKYAYVRLTVHTDTDPELETARIWEQSVVEGSYRTYAVDSTHIEEDKDEKQTVIDLFLKMPLPATFLRINVADTFDFYRPLSIQYLRDSVETQNGWRYRFATLSTGTLSSLEKREFRFEGAISRQWRIVVYNDDNMPLNFGKMELKGYEHTLTLRVTTPADYFLVYGRRNAVKPLYDIDRFEDNIPARLTALSLGPEEDIRQEEAAARQPLFANKNWLWGIMGIVILALGWFTVRMMRKNG